MTFLIICGKAILGAITAAVCLVTVGSVLISIKDKFNG